VAERHPVVTFASRTAYRALRGAKLSLDAAIGALRSRASKGARRQIAIKNAEIVALRSELARVRGEEPPPDPASTPAFFAVGYQKSGTTWLMRMLDSHPEILCKGEGRFFGAGWRQESVRRIDDRRPPSSLHNAVLDAEYLKLWIERSVWSRNDDAEEHLTNLIRMSIDYFLTGELSKTSKRLVGDKSPLLTDTVLEEIAGIYPEAKVIHIIRDGRDAAISAVHHSWNFGRAGKNAETTAKREAYRRDQRELRGAGESIFAGNSLSKLAKEWSDRVDKNVKDGQSLLGSNYSEVRYEDLLEKPEEELRRLLNYLGAEASEEIVRRCVSAASFEKLSKGRKKGEEDPSSFFRKGVAGDWRNTFTEEDRRVFKEVAGDLLIKLGYEKDRDW